MNSYSSYFSTFILKILIKNNFSEKNQVNQFIEVLKKTYFFIKK